MLDKMQTEANASAKKFASYRITSSFNYQNLSQQQKTETLEKRFYNPYLGAPAGFVLENYSA